MIDPEEVARHKLPEAENRRIFTEDIVPDLLEGRVPQQTPAVVFLVGQPGAGKSKVTEMIAGVLNRRGGFVDVDSDLYKPYHDDYEALMAQDDKLMAAYTRADGRAWMAQVEEYVREHRLNAVIQETSQNAAAVEEKMNAYRRAGFRIEALVMGVPEAMSNQGIVDRYFTQVQDRGQGRLTVQANADESYASILELADRIDRGRLVHRANVFRRGDDKPRYSNALDDSGQWQAPPGLRKAIETERSRPWTEHESGGFVETQRKLREGMVPNGSQWATRLTRIEDLAAPLLTPTGTRMLADARRASAAKAGSTAVPAASPKKDSPARHSGHLKADVSVGYDGLQQAAAQLKSGQSEMSEKLQSLKAMVDRLVSSEFHTQLASPKFQESYQQWTTGAQNTVQGLEGMATFLGDVVRGHQELDARLAGGASGS